MRIEVLSIVTSECVCQKNMDTDSKKSFSSTDDNPKNKGTKPINRDIDVQSKRLNNDVLQLKNGDEQVYGTTHGHFISPLSKIHI